MKITGKVFVVTGGGNGMGREVTLGLLKRGAKVAAVDLNEAGLAETAKMMPLFEKWFDDHRVYEAMGAALVLRNIDHDNT